MCMCVECPHAVQRYLQPTFYLLDPVSETSRKRAHIADNVSVSVHIYIQTVQHTYCLTNKHQHDIDEEEKEKQQQQKHRKSVCEIVPNTLLVTEYNVHL